MPDNLLFYGDNLDVLRGRFQDGRPYIADESVDLIYLDPPFNSNADYNAFFAEQDGSRAAAQIKAFGDTWEWNQASAHAYHQFIEDVEVPDRARRALIAFRDLLGDSNMLAYLAMMAPRLVELRKKLKPTGSLYLHCDPTASHYLKVLLDGVFGAKQFNSEIIWMRSGAHNDSKQGRKNLGHIHDALLFYAKSRNWVWNDQFTPYDVEYIDRDYKLIDENGRRFRRDNLTAARPGGDTEYEWRVKKHLEVRERWKADLEDEYLNPMPGWEYRGVLPYRGRYWAYSKDNMRQFAREGRIRHTFEGMPEYKRFLDEMPGVPLQDIWTDIPLIIAGTAERLGYPTQKPVALLERIIQASSNEGDTVLDPFCGCGTTIAAAQKLHRRWIGIDVTSLATTLIKSRLHDQYGAEIAQSYQVIGEPTTVSDAERLATSDPYQFQWWALGLVGARPVEQKKGGDKGIDGRLYFHDDATGASKQVIFSVKAGQSLNPGMVRDLGHVVDREKAAIGVLLTMREPTAGMRTEAAGAGFYHSPGWRKDYPRLQILTVADLLAGKPVELPPTGDLRTFKKAPKVQRSGGQTPRLFADADED